MRIRLAEEHEIDELDEVELDAARRFSADPDYAFVLSCETPELPPIESYVQGKRAFVCEYDQGISGFIFMGEVDDNAHIFQVSVRMKQQGQGIGRRLIEAGLGWAREQGYRNVTLTTYRDARWNGPYYERLGFAPVVPAAPGSELSQILEREKAAGLCVRPRIAMIKPL